MQNMFFFLPLLTSIGALLFEFSLGQFIGMSLGNSSFGYSFVVGTFLLSMGIGSAITSTKKIQKYEPLSVLFFVEGLLVLMSLIALPALSFAMGFVQKFTYSFSSCEALICTNQGIVLILLGVLFLILMGMGVGMEIPFYLKIFPGKLSFILAGDYVGAFLAGLLFSIVFLPELGLMKTLFVASFLHFLALLFFVFQIKADKIKTIISFLLGVVVFFFLLFSKSIEIWSLKKLLYVPLSKSEKILFYDHTQKQSVLFVEHEYENGLKDRMLYLDGFLQFSTLGSLNPYHQSMIKSRDHLDSNPKRLLILGGGDGILADYLNQKNKADLISVVDYDCQLLKAFETNPELHRLSPGAWNNPNIHMNCTDAFWYVDQEKKNSKMWDMIFVDFPHSSGDAAATKVETIEFYTSLNQILIIGGQLLIHYEDYGTPAYECIKNNVRSAGFKLNEQNVKGMAIVTGTKVRNTTFDDIDIQTYHSTLQTEIYQPCYKIKIPILSYFQVQ